MANPATSYSYQQQIFNARVVATANQVGTYFNGPSNNGVGATFTYTSTGALSVDGVTLNVNDRVLLVGQTSALQNGVYTVQTAGNASTAGLLQRSGDQQNIETVKPGVYIQVSAGSLNAGSIWVLVEPQPAALGVNSVNWLMAFSGSALLSGGAQAFPVIVQNVVAGQAALASAGSVTLLPSSGVHQYQILNIMSNKNGTNFSGGGGDRLGQVTDGTNVYTVVPAAQMQTLANSVWGGTATPLPATANMAQLSVAGSPVTFKYSGGTTDYTAGSITLTVVAVQVA